MRVLLALSAKFDLWVWQSDVESAYLNAPLDIELYTRYRTLLERRLNLTV